MPGAPRLAVFGAEVFGAGKARLWIIWGRPNPVDDWAVSPRNIR